MHETENFSSALKYEEIRLANARAKSDYLSVLRHSYIGQSCYYKMLVKFLDFFPIENFLIINFEKDFIQNREETMSNIYTFLNIRDEGIDFNLKSNPASKARFKFVKKIMKSNGLWRVLIKRMIPSLKFRQILKNRIQRANIIKFKPEELPHSLKKEIYDMYFADQIVLLEELLDRKMNWEI